MARRRAPQPRGLLTRLIDEIRARQPEFRQDSLGTGFLGGLIFVMAFAAVLTWLCLGADKKIKAEYALGGKK